MSHHRRIRILVALVTASALLALTAPAQEKTTEQPKTPAEKGAAKMDSAKNPVVALKTSMGTITLELYPDKAPITVKNFLAYVDEKFFDSTIFHRVINGFMIQGGGFTADMAQKKTRPAITIESQNGLKNVQGSIAMARTPDPNSATSQFFINIVDNPNLDYPKPDGHGYTVFGRVSEGFDVVDKIKAVRTGNKGGHQNVPVETVTIGSVRRVDAAAAQPATKKK